MLEELKTGYKKAKEHSDLRDAPHKRVGSLLLNLVSDSTLPTVMLGGWVTAYISWQAGTAPEELLWWWTGALVLSFILYAVGDETKAILQAIADEVDDPDQDDDRTYQ